MCDYSLMNLPNRLANEGEILVTHRFASGSIGFVSPADLRSSRVRALPVCHRGFWAHVGAWFRCPDSHSLSAVCIPPGARLQALSISDALRKVTGIQPGDEVTFNQSTAEWGQYRDALWIAPGRQVLLQCLSEGAEFQVMRFDSVSEAAPEQEYVYDLLPHR